MTKWVLRTYEELDKDDLYEILKLRQIVFAVEQNCVYLDIDDIDKKSHHLYTCDDSGVIAYLRIIEPGVKSDNVHIGRFITAGRVRGRGFGIEILKYAIKIIERLYSETTIVISAQRYLDKYYDLLGFKAVGEEYLEDGIPHVKRIYKK